MQNTVGHYNDSIGDSQECFTISPKIAHVLPEKNLHDEWVWGHIHLMPEDVLQFHSLYGLQKHIRGIFYQSMSSVDRDAL